METEVTIQTLLHAFLHLYFKYMNTYLILYVLYRFQKVA